MVEGIKSATCLYFSEGIKVYENGAGATINQ